MWTEEQLAAFPVVGRCARLVTTRSQTLASAAGVAVKVDQMSATQAQALLLAGLPPLPPLVVQGLIGETGQWPLLLRLVNKILPTRPSYMLTSARRPKTCWTRCAAAEAASWMS